MAKRKRAESNPELRSLPVFFLDLQTTGSTPASGEILEIGWKGSRAPSSSPTSLVLEAVEPVPRRIRSLTGITEDEIAAAVSAEEARARFEAFLRSENYEHSVIHYARFERPFLSEWFPESPFETLCSFEIARRLLPNLPSRGIQGLAGYFGYPGKELKRATSQVLATEAIWNGLVALLEERKVLRLSELQDFLASPVPKKTKHEYRITAERRLALPSAPGIYRMLGKNGEVLYVGKATSLRDRVNSYFRGRKGRDPRKLVMLTQVWEIETVECETPLEAALLEVDEIKRWDPPYNVSLKRGDRRLVFYSRDFSSSSEQEDEIHNVGPFPNAFALEWVFRLVDAARADPPTGTPRFTETFFHEPRATEVIEGGWRLFLERNALEPSDFFSVRSALAVGLRWFREILATEEEEAEEIEEEAIEALSSEESDEEESLESQIESAADRFERYLIGSAASLWRARVLTRLLDREITLPGTETRLYVRRARIERAPRSPLSPSHSERWRGLGVEDYDRMSVLRSELDRMGKNPKVPPEA